MANEKSTSQFEQTPAGWSARWQEEIKQAKKALKPFYDVAKEVDEALRDEAQDNGGRRLCLYQSSTKTIGAMLFGRMPQAAVSRKFEDADDDEARVASEMLERVLNCDLQRADDTFAEATRNAMMDWVGPGLGVERHRYEVGPMEEVPGTPAKLDPMTGQEIAPEVPATEKPTWERVNTDYVPLKNFLWDTSANTWSDVPWVAVLAKMSKEKVAERFDSEDPNEPKISETVPFNSKAKREGGDDSEKSHPWDRADVWEVWHKESKKVFWVVEGYSKCLDIKDDPLQLEGFFPVQRPLMANLTTSKLIPVSDYKFAQDLYRSVDVLTTRIALLSKVVRVAGVYAKEATSTVEKLIDGGENKLYPVDQWAALMENGGTQGLIAYLPLDQIVATLATLRDLRREDIDLIYQVTGQSDVMRGMQTQNGTPGEAQVKAKFGSVRLQSAQDELARFASDGQRIRAEIISKHFAPETIIEHSNIMRTQDAPLAQQAAQLLKSPRFADYRIEVKPEAINLTDFAALKAECMEVLATVGAFFQAIAPIMAMGPPGRKLSMGMLKTTLARLKGGSIYETIVDQALAEAEQLEKQQAANPQQPPPDPKIQAQMMKGQQDMAKIQAELQADMQMVQAEVQADAQREANQMQFNVREHQAKAQISAALKPPPPPNGRPGR